jgi:hypothetical protein
LDALPEVSEERKRPSRWGAAFVRSEGGAGVTDAGNKLYAKVLKTVEVLAGALGHPQSPLAGLGRKTNIDKINDRCGDYVEAVLGRPLLARHLPSGGVDTGYNEWTAEKAREYALEYNSGDPDDLAAARMLQCVAAAEDVEAARTSIGITAEMTCFDFVNWLTASVSFGQYVAWTKDRLTELNATRIRENAPTRPAGRMRSAAGMLKQLRRRAGHRQGRQLRGDAESMPDTEWSFGRPGGSGDVRM